MSDKPDHLRTDRTGQLRSIVDDWHKGGLRYVVARRQKALTALATGIGMVLSAGLAHGDVELGLEIGLSALTVLGVHGVPNAKAYRVDQPGQEAA